MKKLLISMLVASILMLMLAGCGGNPDETTIRPTNENPTEHDLMTEPLMPGTRYVYHALDGKYASYVQGKVIEAERIGEKLMDADFIGGWVRYPGDEQLTEENLRAEIFSIANVSEDVAVAVRFIDIGDALTTTHYYAIINPNADIDPISEYFIPDPFA